MNLDLSESRFNGIKLKFIRKSSEIMVFLLIYENIDFKILEKIFLIGSISLSDIQEFYELTLLDESKSVQQKTAETLLIASKWEHENSIKLTDVSINK